MTYTVANQEPLIISVDAVIGWLLKNLEHRFGFSRGDNGNPMCVVKEYLKANFARSGEVVLFGYRDGSIVAGNVHRRVEPADEQAMIDLTQRFDHFIATTDTKEASGFEVAEALGYR